MKRLIWLVVGVGVLGLAGLAAPPETGLPVLDVKATVPGGYILLIQNNRSYSVTAVKLVLKVEVAKITALTLNGPAVLSVERKGAGQVWWITFAEPGLRPDPWAYLLVGVEGVTPPVEAECERLVRYVFPWPPFHMV